MCVQCRWSGLAAVSYVPPCAHRPSSNLGSPDSACSVHEPPKSLGVFCSPYSSRADTGCSMAVLAQGFWAPRTKEVLAFVPAAF